MLFVRNFWQLQYENILAIILVLVVRFKINVVLFFFVVRNFNFHDVHVEGARAVAEACRDTGVQKLVHFSALGASYDSKSRFMQSKVP